MPRRRRTRQRGGTASSADTSSTDTGSESAAEDMEAELTRSEDGTITMTDKEGNVITVDPETGDISAEINTESETGTELVYNAEDAAADVGDMEYLGTNPETGAANYVKKYLKSELEEYDADAAAAEAAEDAAIIEYANSETISGEALDEALSKALEWDTYVRNNYWEPVYEKSESIENEEYYTSSHIETTEITEEEPVEETTEEEPEEGEPKEEPTEEETTEEELTEETDERSEAEKAEEKVAEEEKTEETTIEEEPVEVLTEDETNDAAPSGYRLKDEYARQTIETDMVSFGIADEDGTALQANDANDANEAVVPEYHDATVVILDDSLILIRVVDENNHGIPGATVTVERNGKTYQETTKEISGDPEGAGSVLLDVSGDTTVQNAFVNISAPGYRGITRLSEPMKGGDVLTYKLYKAENGEIYLRGATLDGIDIYETNYELFISQANDSRYDIVAFVEKVGASPDELQSSLYLYSDTRKVGEAGKVSVAQSEGLGYARYTFTGTWSKYNKNNPIFKPGDTIRLNWSGDGSQDTSSSQWADTKSSAHPLKIAVSLPVAGDASWWSGFKLSLSNAPLGGGGSATIPNSVPGIGGASAGVSELIEIPVICLIDPDGSIIVGYGDNSPAKEFFDAIKKMGDPREIAPGKLGNREPLKERLKEKLRKSYQDAIANRNRFTSQWPGTWKKLASIVDDGTGTYAYWGFMLIAQWDRRTGYVDGKLSAYITLEGRFGRTIYLSFFPIYFSVLASATARLSFTVGTHVYNFDTSKIFSGFTDDTGYTLLLGVVVSITGGLGIKGLAAAEAYVSAGIDAQIDIAGTPPPGKFLPRFRFYANANYGWKVYVFCFWIKKSYSFGAWRIVDSWNVDDPTDVKPNIPGGPVTMSLLANDTEGNRVVASALIADNELREAVGKAANQEGGLYVQQGDASSAEITINKDGDQQANMNYVSVMADDGPSDPEGTETQLLSGITVSQKMVYTGATTQGRYLRIANVIDHQNYNGKVVPRVTMTRADIDGLIGDPIALPATIDDKGNVYGYDYNYGVYMADDDYCYIAITSTSIDPATSTLQQVAENSRIRVVVMKGDTLVDSRILEKPADENGNTNYLFLGTPVLYANHDAVENPIGGYAVTCSATNRLNAITAAAANDESATITYEHVYYATNIPASLHYDWPHALILTAENASGVDNLEIIRRKQGSGDEILSVVYTESPNNSIMHEKVMYNYGTGLRFIDDGYKRLGEEVHNWQHAEGGRGDILYYTANGQLKSINFGRNDDITAYPTKTDTNEDVLLPISDGLQLIACDGLVYVVTSRQQRGDDDGKGGYKTDSVIEIYTLYEGGKFISGPREITLKNRSVFSATGAVLKDETGSRATMRVMYLADPQVRVVKLPSGGLEADQYYAGVEESVCNLYMWELRFGSAAQLESIKADQYYVRKSDGVINFQANVQNIGALAADHVTVRVTSNKETQADAQDIEIYFSDDGTQNGANRHKLGPGSTMSVPLKVPIQDAWRGVTTLYAAVIKVNGEEMTGGYTPVWVDDGQLLDNGAFEISVEEDGIGVKPYALVQVDNYSAVSYDKVAIQMEVSYYTDEPDTWIPERRYKIETWDDGSSATGIEDKVATLQIPLEEYWNNKKVYAVRFTIVSTAGDVTLNNLYKISDTLIRPDLPEEFLVLVNADVADSTNGSVEFLVSNDGQIGQYVDKGTQLTIKATPNEGYQFSHWEVYDFSSEGGVWTRIPDATERLLTVTAGENVPGTTIGKDEDSLYLQAVFQSDGSTRVIVTGINQTTDDDGNVEYASGSLNGQLTITQEGDVTEAESKVTTSYTYRLRNGGQIEAVPEFDPDDWIFDGWYYFTYDENGTVTPGEKVGAELLGSTTDVVTVTQSAATSEVCVAAIFHENEDPGIKVYLDSEGGSLVSGYTKAKVNEWVDAKEIQALPAVGDITREGYTFDGWADVDGNKYTDISQVQTSYTTLFAQWQQSKIELVAFAADENGEIQIVGASQEDPGYKEYDRGPDGKATAEVTATPVGSATFDHWAVYNIETRDFDPIQGDANLSYTMEQNTYLMAVFNGTQPEEGDIDVNINVRWKYKDSTSVRPNSIKVQLYKDGSPADEIVMLSMNNDWQYTWKGLDENATYTVKVLDVPVTDQATVSGNQLQGFTVNYTCGGQPEPEVTVDRSVEIQWALNVGAARPDSVQVRIKDADGWVASDDLTLRASDDKSKNWKGTFTGLSEGKTYTVLPLNLPDGYKAEISGTVYTGWVITITGGSPDVPKTISTPVSVRWRLNAGAAKPAYVKVRLSERGVIGKITGALFSSLSFHQDEEATLMESNGWEATYEGLTATKDYVLSVTDLPKSYSAVVSGEVSEGYIVTIYGGTVPQPDPQPDPENPGSSGGSGGTTISTDTSTAYGDTISVKIDWQMNDGESRPDYIKVQLVKADGTVAGDYVVTLDESNSWRYSWQPINVGEGYSLRILDYTGAYKLVVTGDAAHGYTITCLGGSGTTADTTLTDANGNPVDANGNPLVDANGNPIGTADGTSGNSSGNGDGAAAGNGAGDHISATGDDSLLQLWWLMAVSSGMILAMWFAWRRGHSNDRL